MYLIAMKQGFPLTKSRVVAFDLDGTLVNTVPSITLSLNAALAIENRGSVTPEFVMERVGLPVESLFEHLSLGSGELNTFVLRFREKLKENLSSSTDVFPGILDSLNLLSNSGAILVVATSKPTKLANLTLQNVGLLPFFNHVVGTDNSKHKPDPWVLFESRKLVGRPVDLYIGDRLEDAEAAFRASTDFIGLLHSYHTEADFSKFPNKAILQNSSRLTDFLLKFLV
jgi:phosphoglycolate phosphatase